MKRDDTDMAVMAWTDKLAALKASQAVALAAVGAAEAEVSKCKAVADERQEAVDAHIAAFETAYNLVKGT